jgi:hypothetical protein
LVAAELARPQVCLNRQKGLVDRLPDAVAATGGRAWCLASNDRVQKAKKETEQSKRLSDFPLSLFEFSGSGGGI